MQDHLLRPPAVGTAFLTLRCCSSCSDLGFLTVSSIDRMVQAASVAAFKAFTLTSRGSQTKLSLLSAIPSLMSMPLNMFSSPPLSDLIANYGVCF